MSKIWVSIFLINSSLTIFIGCVSKKIKPDPQFGVAQASQKVQRGFERGIAYLDGEKYKLALKEFDQILKSNPTSEFGLVAWFNKGAALEGLGRCREATKVYRKVLRISNKRYLRIEAQSLFRLSYTYECLGDIPKQIASLRDAFYRKQFLAKEVSEAELPARLAAAYARSGDLATAEKYFEKAQKGLLQVHKGAGDPFRYKELLSRTLYFMGRIQVDPIRISKQSKAYIGSLKYLQAYLLKSSEMASQEWSLKAADNLVKAYKVIWQVLERPPRFKVKSKDKAIRDKVLKQWRFQLARGAMDNIQSLKSMRFPDSKEPLAVQGIFKEMAKQERKFEAYLAELAVNTDLTPEAKIRRGLHRQGKVKSSTTKLELKAIQRSKLLEKKRKKSRKKKGRR